MLGMPTQRLAAIREVVGGVGATELRQASPSRKAMQAPCWNGNLAASVIEKLAEMSTTDANQKVCQEALRSLACVT